MATKAFSQIAILLETFFTDHLMTQRQVSQHTIASYRDTFRLLLQFAQRELHKPPAVLTIDDLSVSFVKKFLFHLESTRAVSARTRNQRLAAIRSCFRFAALYLPEKSHLIQQVLALPSKRDKRTLISFLTEEEVTALLAAPDTSLWSGKRDYTLMLLAIQTGMRVSEITGIRRADLHLGSGVSRTLPRERKEGALYAAHQANRCRSYLWLRHIPDRESEPSLPVCVVSP